MGIFHYPTRFKRNGDGVDFLQYNFYGTKMWGWFVIFNVRWLTHVMQRWPERVEQTVKVTWNFIWFVPQVDSWPTHEKNIPCIEERIKTGQSLRSFMIKKRVWILSSNEFPGDQTDFVNLDKHLTSEVLGGNWRMPGVVANRLLQF